jgi:hypothetical protein
LTITFAGVGGRHPRTLPGPGGRMLFKTAQTVANAQTDVAAKKYQAPAAEAGRFPGRPRPAVRSRRRSRIDRLERRPAVIPFARH